MVERPKAFVVETEENGKVLVTVDSTGFGAFVSVSPYDPKPFGAKLVPVVWVSDARRDLAAMLPA
jgi:hypothetical protein